jgi:hypothetical protein
LTEPDLLSDWAVQGGLLDAAITVTADDLAAAIELREAITGPSSPGPKVAGPSWPTSNCGMGTCGNRAKVQAFRAPASAPAPISGKTSGTNWIRYRLSASGLTLED